MRQKIVAGNWKMNMNKDEAKALFLSLNNSDLNGNVNTILVPPNIYLSEFSEYGMNKTKLGAQNVYSKSNGAFTGEISASMLSSIQVDYCLVGHSERREYFCESNQFLSEKIDSLLENNITPIYCFGENLKDRDSDNHFDLVKSQIKEGLFHLSSNQFSKVILAYEPVWAIGTGKTASSDQAQEMHKFVRDLVKEQYDEEMASSTSILYGGSCKPSNAKELFSCPDVDGGLIGGAALKSEDFLELISIAGTL